MAVETLSMFCAEAGGKVAELAAGSAGSGASEQHEQQEQRGQEEAVSPEQVDAADDDSEMESDHESDGEVEGAKVPRIVAHGTPHLQRRPELFRVVEGYGYHELCAKQAAAAPKVEPLVDTPLAQLNLSVEHMERIGAEALAYARATCLTREGWQLRSEVRQVVQDTLQKNPSIMNDYPNLRVDLFGTCGSGLASSKSDVDLLLDLDGRGNIDLQRDKVVEFLRDVLQVLSAAGSNLELICDARVPIIRGQVAGLQFDLSVGSPCGLWNTSFLRSCVQSRPELVLPLCS
eukprot:4767017-Amphidinium_carterae.2